MTKRRRGRPNMETPSVVTSFAIYPDQLESLRSIAKKRGKTQGALLRELIDSIAA